MLLNLHMKLHLPQRLFKALLAVFACFSVSQAAVAVPDGYTTVQINSAADLAAFTPEESVNYAFVVADGVSLQGTKGQTLLPAGSVWVQADGSMSFAGAVGDGNESYLFSGDSLTLTGGSLDIRGWQAKKGVIHGAINTTNMTVQDTTGTVRFGDCTATGYSAVITVAENGSVAFSGNKGSVLFENNQAYRYEKVGISTKESGRGAAVYLDSGATLNVSGNADVAFRGNNSRDTGGAIHANTLRGNEARINFSDNGRVEFSNNMSRDNGGAIYGHFVSFTGNGEVLFSGNQANESTSVGGGVYMSPVPSQVTVI